MATKSTSMLIKSGFIGSFARIDENTVQLFKEFIDNATTSYYDNMEMLDKIVEEKKCIIKITWNDEEIVIHDNAFGMDEEAFLRALHVNDRAESYSDISRSQYGLGLKYAAVNFGKWYSIETTQYGNGKKYYAEIDVDYFENENPERLDYQENDCMSHLHGTKITIRRLSKKISNPNTTKGSKLKGVFNLESIIDELSNVYAEDLKNGKLILEINGIKAVYREPQLMINKETGSECYSSFSNEFDFEGKTYKFHGWIGILAKGNVQKAGFTLLQQDRAIQLHYRPLGLFGQENDFRYQRIVGDIFLEGKDSWVVTFTKDAIKWSTGLEEAFLEAIYSIPTVEKMFKYAKSYRKNTENVNNNQLDNMELGKTFENVTKNDSEPNNNTSKPMMPTSKPGAVNIKPMVNKPAIPKADSTKENKDIVVPITYKGINYEFIIKPADQLDSDWFKLRRIENEKHKYELIVNVRTSFFDEFKKNESKKLIVMMAISVALAQLSCEESGLKLIDSQILINQLNDIMKKCKEKK